MFFWNQESKISMLSDCPNGLTVVFNSLHRETARLPLNILSTDLHNCSSKIPIQNLLYAEMCVCINESRQTQISTMTAVRILFLERCVFFKTSQY